MEKKYEKSPKDEFHSKRKEKAESLHKEEGSTESDNICNISHPLTIFSF
jgi:hypothetical protein